MATVVNSQTLTERQKAPVEQEQSNACIGSAEREVLQPRVKGLAACACLMAQGDLTRLEPAVRTALDNGVTINELKEAFSQLYAYTGFPRSLNALGILNKVLENRQPDWQEGKPWKRPVEWDDAKKAYELGKKNQTQLSGRPFNYDFCPQDDYYLKAHLFGDIFAGDQLSAADREIVTVAALSGLEGVAPQLAAHKQGAVNMGNSKQLVDELSAWLCVEGYTLSSKWAKGEPNPYGKYFIGQSYLADVGGGVMNVTFEPRCRNNWHVHHGAGAGAYLRGWQRMVSGVGQGGSRDDSRHRHCRSCRGEALSRSRQGLMVPAPDVPQGRTGGCLQRVAGGSDRRGLRPAEMREN